MTRIIVHDENLTLVLPEWMDTNETYKLVRPDGRSYDVIYDTLSDKWDWMPF